MKKEINISIDEEILSIVEQAASNNDQSLSAFFEYAALVYIVKNVNNADMDTRTLNKLEVPNTHSVITNNTSTTKTEQKLTHAQSKEIIDGFVKFFNEKLNSVSGQYIWKYEINEESRVSWLDPSYCQGETYEDTRRLLSLCGQKLKQAMENKDEQLCFEAVRLAMDWGGAYYDFNRYLQKGNEKVVIELHQNGLLLKTITLNYERIINNDFEAIDYFTSGWSIIWHALAPEKLIIMSSREIYAFNKVILEYKEKKQIDRLPSEIDLGQLVYKGNKRYIEGIKYVYTRKGKLKMLKKYMGIINKVKELGDLSENYEIDFRLFVMGEI